jgi:DNA-directed RNA polymerase specialized sigma subunit
MNKQTKERIIESHLRHYRTYKIGIVNCQKQLDYIMPNITARYDYIQGSTFYIGNNTERVAIDRVESKRALDLHEEIEKYKIITESIDNAFSELSSIEQKFVDLRYFDRMAIYDVKTVLGYSEDKSVFRIRRHVLDRFFISLNNLLTL